MHAHARLSWRLSIVVATLVLMLGAPLGLAQEHPAAAPAAAQPRAGISGARYPSLSPDGKTLTFTYKGDIWTVPATGGEATRLTLHRAYDVRSRYSPGGTRVAFTSNRGYGYDVWITDARGGKPTRLTQHAANDYLIDWYDSESVLILSFRDGEPALYRVPLSGATPARVTRYPARYGALSADNKTIVITMGTANTFQLQYKGSGNHDLYRVDLTRNDAEPVPLTTSPYNDVDPVVTKDGWVYYRSETPLAEADKPAAGAEGASPDGGASGAAGASGNNAGSGGDNGGSAAGAGAAAPAGDPARKIPAYNIWRVPLDGSKKPEPVTALSGSTGLQALSYNAATDTIVFDAGFQLWSLALTESAKPTRLAITIRSDDKGDAAITRTITKGSEQPHVSPDGRYMAFSLMGDLWVMPANGGKAVRLTQTAAREQWPRFSPDGRTLAYFSNAAGNNDLWLMDVRTRRTRQLTKHPKDDFYFGWSPDGKSIAFCSERDGDRDIWLIDVTNPASVIQLTNNPGSDDDPTFTPDGRVVWDSAKTGNQEVWIMDADGGNARQITRSPNFDQVPTVSPDGRFVVYESIPEGGSQQIWMIGIDGGSAMQVVPAGSAPVYTPDGKQIVYTQGNMILQIAAPEGITVGRAIPMLAQVQTSARAENARVFDEAWLAMKNGFYDEKLHGVDWDAIKKRYRPLAISADNKEEFFLLTNRMLGELKASHVGHHGATEYSRARGNTGLLGCDFEIVTTPRGVAARLTRVVPNGPADRAWMRAGDHIFGVNGKRLREKSNFYALLSGTTGKPTRLLVSPGEAFDKGRNVSVTPISTGQLNQLKYRNWVKKNGETVARASQNKLAYVHLNAMDATNLERFKSALQGPAKNKAALVLDVRNNGGGNIHQELLDILGRKPFGRFHPRGGKATSQPNLTWNKPVVVLINARSFSDAELFPFGFRALGLGPIVGVATPGAVIGTNDIKLSDGSSFRIPRVGWYGMDGTNLEGLGVKPDFRVPLTPQDKLAGRDPQLNKAIELMLDAIKPKSKPNGSAPPAPPAQPATPSTPESPGTPENPNG